MDMFHRPFGRRAFRCRTCHVRFYATPHPALAAASAAASHAKRSGKPKANGRSKRRRRWMVQAIVFAVMLLLFAFFLRYLTREQPSSSGIGQTPASVPASD